MKHVLVIPGDGIGPEVILPSVEIISSLRPEIKFDFSDAGKDEFERTGVSISDELIEAAKKSDAVFFGATTSVLDSNYISPIITLRQELDLFANVRIAKGITPSAREVDMVIIRENTEGLYTGKEDRDALGVTTLRRVSKKGCERIVKFAFDWCERHSRRKLTCVHKANVLRLSDGLFLEIFNSEKAGRKKIEASDALIDSTALRMVMSPSEFDSIVTLNLYGDILSDLAAGLIGGLGFMPSANMGSRNAVFEPAHGSAPDIAGRGCANPFASLLSGAMMLEYLGYAREASALISAVEKTASEGKRLFDGQGRCNTNAAIANVRKTLGIGKASNRKKNS